MSLIIENTNKNIVLTTEFILAKTKLKDIKSVKKLNCWACNLTDVSILKEMPNLEILTLSVNNIATLEPLRNCEKLCELYLRNNQINDISEIFYLKHLKNLKILWLGDNKCAIDNLDYNYRMTVLRNLPNLNKLDNATVTQEELDASITLGKLIKEVSNSIATKPNTPIQHNGFNYQNDFVNQMILPITDDLKYLTQQSLVVENDLLASQSTINTNKSDDELKSLLESIDQQVKSFKMDADSQNSTSTNTNDNDMDDDLILKTYSATDSNTLNELNNKSRLVNVEESSVESNENKIRDEHVIPNRTQSNNVLIAVLALVKDLNLDGLDMVIKECELRKNTFLN